VYAQAPVRAAFLSSARRRAAERVREMAGAVACTPATLAKRSLGENQLNATAGRFAAVAALGHLASICYEVLNQKFQRQPTRA
jgi:hypothetical protein